MVLGGDNMPIIGSGVKYHLDKAYIQEPISYGRFSLFQVGRMHCAEDTVVQTHTHLQWLELTVIKGGRGKVYANGIGTEVQRGDIYLSLPADFHAIESDRTDPLRFDFLSFFFTDQALVDTMEQRIIPNATISQRVFHSERIEQLVNIAIAEVSAPQEDSEELITLILEEIMLLLVRSFRTPSDHLPKSIGKPEELCYQIMHYIDTHVFSLSTLSEVADALHYHYSYLSGLFHEVTKDTIAHYYQRRRMEAAMLLLSENTRTISEIAELLQYSSIFTFSRAFRDYAGLSPSEYRQEHNKTI